MALSQGVDLDKVQVVGPKIQRFLAREDRIHSAGEFLEGEDVLEADVFIVKEIEESVRVREILQAIAIEQRPNLAMRLHQGVDLFLAPAQRVDDLRLFALGIGVQRPLEVMAHAHIIHHEALVFELVADAVDAGDGLQQVVIGDHLVQIHDLFDGGVEAGEQHVVDDDDTHPAIHLRRALAFDRIERQLEAPDAALMIVGIGVGLDMGFVVVAARDDHGRLQAAQAIQVDGEGVALLQLGHFGGQRLVQLGLVAGGCLARDGHHLRLEAVGEDEAHIVVDHISRFGANGRLGFQIGVA